MPCLNSTTGERHIADVRTSHGVVVEFQRSSIDPAEVIAREQFYQRIVWVVDGTRNEFDPFSFSNSRSQVDSSGLAAFSWTGRSKLLQRWLTTKPVFIDFGPQHGFWRIARFNAASKRGVALLVNPEHFVARLTAGETDFSSNGGPASV